MNTTTPSTRVRPSRDSTLLGGARRCGARHCCDGLLRLHPLGYTRTDRIGRRRRHYDRSSDDRRDVDDRRAFDGGTVDHERASATPRSPTGCCSTATSTRRAGRFSRSSSTCGIEQVAATVPGCAAYVDSVFASDDAPNTTAARWFHAPPGRAGAMGQWVVVLPTEADVTTLFDAVTAPDFVAGCRLPYMEAAKASPVLYCCDTSVPAVPPVYPDAVERVRPGTGPRPTRVPQ